MGIPHYLAMTAAELSQNPPEGPIAWLACHFSPYHRGLSNLPGSLPAGSILVLDDSAPMDGHDIGMILCQLKECLTEQNCAGLLLDLQRPGNDQVRELARQLTRALPRPVAVSHYYAKNLDCPVFLPPAPLHISLENYLRDWKGREIWLETALDKEILTLTEAGCRICPAADIPGEGFREEGLHCHYSVETGEDYARFTLWRTPSDLEELLSGARPLGVTLAVGLWQELGRIL